MGIILFKKEKINIYIGYLAITYAFCLPLSRGAIGVLGALIILLWIVEGDLKSKFRLYIDNGVTRGLILFVLSVLIVLIWTDVANIKEALGIDKRYWYLFVLFIFMTSLPKAYIFKVLSAFIMGMFVSEIIAYGVFFDFWEFGRASKSNPSPFMHHIEYSIFLAITSLILLNRIFSLSHIGHKLFYTIFFFTVTGNLFLTSGRTGQLAFLFGLFVLSILSFSNKFKALLIFTLISSTIFIAGFNLSDTFHNRILMAKSSLSNSINRQNYCSSVGNRVGAYIISWDIIKQDPLLGVGYVDNMREFHKIIDKDYPNMRCLHHSMVHTHNQFLQILTGGGIISLILFLSIFYYLFRLPIQDREISNIRYIYLSVEFMGFIPEVLWGRQFSLSLSALMIGLILAQYRSQSE